VGGCFQAAVHLLRSSTHLKPGVSKLAGKCDPQSKTELRPVCHVCFSVLYFLITHHVNQTLHLDLMFIDRSSSLAFVHTLQ